MTQCWSNSTCQTILAQYTPVLVGVNEAEFYGNMSAHIDVIDLAAWDAAAFAQALNERIVQPGARAKDMRSVHDGRGRDHGEHRRSGTSRLE